MEPKSIEQTVSEMREYIIRDVAAGFSTSDEICESVVEVFYDEHPSSDLIPYAKSIIQEAIESHLKEQAKWKEATDCDRLDQAFEDLERQGIISRQNFSCCGTCGSAEILDEMASAKNKGKKVRGYAFFHVQDTELAVEGNGIYLNYGSAYNNYFAQILAGHKIVKVIKNHGLKVEWNGSLSRRIFVH
ncbi:MAG: hypothetical protein HYU84_06720, partial [Chloroflexi bacterium]|nr:hypothetical protein [Chloroflexota bacterium]